MKFENLPTSWELAPISDVADLNPKSYCLLDSADKLRVHFIPMSAVSEEFGVLISVQNLPGNRGFQR